MPLKLTCPTCRQAVPLDEPFPLPGDAVVCTACGASMAVSYPDAVFAQLRARGKRFAQEPPASAPQVLRPPSPPEPPSEASNLRLQHVDSGSVSTAGVVNGGAAGHAGTALPTEIDRTTTERTELGLPSDDHGLDRTVASSRSPYGGLPGNAPEPESDDDEDWKQMLGKKPRTQKVKAPVSPTDHKNTRRRPMRSASGTTKNAGRAPSRISPR